MTYFSTEHSTAGGPWEETVVKVNEDWLVSVNDGLVTSVKLL